MNDYTLNLIINIALMAFAILSVIELVYDKSTKGSFFRKISRRGWLLITFTFLSIVFNLYKDFKAYSTQETSERERRKLDSLFDDSQRRILELQLSTKDTVLYGVENAYSNSIKASNQALARYNLRITDSMRAVVNTLKLNAVNPQLLIAPLEPGKQPAFVTNDSGVTIFNIQLVSKGGTSYHILLTCYLLKQGPHPSILKSFPSSYGGAPLAEDITSTRELQLPREFLSESRILVLITGSFSRDQEGTHTIPFDSAFEFNFKENKYITALEYDFQSLKKQLNIK